MPPSLWCFVTAGPSLLPQMPPNIASCHLGVINSVWVLPAAHIAHGCFHPVTEELSSGNRDHRRRRWHPTPVLLPVNPMDRGACRLQSMGSWRVRHDWATSLSLFTFMQWRRKWQPTPVFLPRESQGRWSLVGCCLWGCTESDTTEAT